MTDFADAPPVKTTQTTRGPKGGRVAAHGRVFSGMRRAAAAANGAHQIETTSTRPSHSTPKQPNATDANKKKRYGCT
jgi:hypothetical protein